MSELINLLIVEDSEHDAILLAHDLRKAGFEINMLRVQTAQEMQTALAAENLDAVISDYNLPVFSAPRALEILRQSGKDLPFIVVSGTIGEATAVEIMRSGAHDYLMKGNLNRLAEVLRREIREARGRDDSRRAEIALKESEEQLRLLFERSSDAIFIIEKKTGRYLNANLAAEKLTGMTVEELKALTSAEVIKTQAVEASLKDVLIASDSLAVDALTYLRPDGTCRMAKFTILPINDERAFGIAHDITEQLQAENTLRHRAQELEVLYRTSLEINSQTDLLPLLQTIVERAANLLNAHMGGLYLLRPDENNLELVVAYNLPGNFVGAHLKMGEGLSGAVAQTGQVIMVDDYRIWPNRATLYESVPFLRVLGVPMRVNGQVIGTINITDDEITGSYSVDEIRLASLFADQAAIAVENARLLSAVQRELTERRQAELALRESEEHYRIVVTGAPLITFVIDANGIFTLSEGKGLDVLGLQPGQVVGQSVFDLYRLFPEIIEDVRAVLNGETRHRDTRIGANIFETHYIPILDENGHVSHVIGVANDISERQKAEESLRESEKSYRGLFNSVTDAIYIQDDEGRFLDINGGAIRMYGYQKSEILGKTPEFLGAPGKNDLAAVAQAVKKAFSGEAQQFEFWGLRANGEIFPKEVRAFPGTYFGQQVIITLAHDITERKKAEENLRSTQVFLDHVLKAIPLGISIYNTLTSSLEFDNVVSAHIHETNMTEFNALSISERQDKIHPDDRKVLGEFIGNLVTLADGEIRSIEYRRKGRAGGTAWRWLRYRYFVFERDPNGSIIKLLSVTEDVTGSKQAEQALQRQLKELTTLHNIARAGIQVNSLDELVELVTQEVGNSFYTENFGVLLLDAERKVLHAHPSYRGLTEDIHAVIALENSISGQVLKTGKPCRVADVKLEPNYVRVTENIISELCVPIKTGDDTFGVINAESKQVDFFSDDDERLLLTIAGQLAISIERLRLFNSEKERRQEAENLRQATAALSTSLDLDHVLESILTSLKQVVPYDSASVFLLDGDHLHIVIVDGIEDTAELYKKTFPSTDPLFQEVKTRRLPIILADASSDPRYRGWGSTSRVRGWMSVPLITRGEVIGYITLDNYTDAVYSQEAGTMAQSFAHQAAAAIENARLFKEIQISLEELNQAYESTIEGWSKAMDLRDKETEGHTLRVTDITMKLAEALGLEGELLVHIRRGALLHDIGKMGVPDRILLKPDSLSDDELIIMRRHPKYAYDMLSPIAYLHPALDIPYCHHERWDGKGYPRGLQGKQIPLAARLFSVVDVWDALTSDRPYRPAWSHKEALGYIKALSGVQFEPEIVEKFTQLMDNN
ncbi:MAG: PAS domain S-box protein [Chloroflexi bacterium]|nr:PAS domain S-box protein [Chloroflexota bacterium]